MENNMMVRTDETQAIRRGTQPVNDYHSQLRPFYDEIHKGKLVDEVIATVKDDRMNTKRAISADIAATARVQNQNGQVIQACERELHRRDLPEERRAELLEIMSKAAESTAYESAASREFQEEQLNHSHKLPWRILGCCVLILFGGIGGTTLLKTAA